MPQAFNNKLEKGKPQIELIFVFQQYSRKVILRKRKINISYADIKTQYFLNIMFADKIIHLIKHSNETFSQFTYEEIVALCFLFCIC